MRWSRAGDHPRGWFAKVMLEVVWKWSVDFKPFTVNKGLATFSLHFFALERHFNGFSQTNDSCLKWKLRPASGDTQQFLSIEMFF
jgi:hypothetical protein